jgi:hypothetical protein
MDRCGVILLSVHAILASARGIIACYYSLFGAPRGRQMYVRDEMKPETNKVTRRCSNGPPIIRSKERKAS